MQKLSEEITPVFTPSIFPSREEGIIMSSIFSGKINIRLEKIRKRISIESISIIRDGVFFLNSRQMNDIERRIVINAVEGDIAFKFSKNEARIRFWVIHPDITTSGTANGEQNSIHAQILRVFTKIPRQKIFEQWLLQMKRLIDTKL